MRRIALALGALLAFASGFGLSACQYRERCNGCNIPLEPGRYEVQSDQDWLDGTTLLIRERTRSIRIEWPTKEPPTPYLEAELSSREETQ